MLACQTYFILYISGRKAEKLYEIIRNLGIDRTSFLPGVMLGNQLMTFFEGIQYESLETHSSKFRKV